ncbi:uncharacterized protein EI90DRAFT_3040173, partial [Cantharellus anzutake]|uniref:uncharacterized protein n=1 Tax=Cantharellus anzutake TaxID=1750568 RepID=UPI001905EE8E
MQESSRSRGVQIRSQGSLPISCSQSALQFLLVSCPYIPLPSLNAHPYLNSLLFILFGNPYIIHIYIHFINSFHFFDSFLLSFSDFVAAFVTLISRSHACGM